MRTTIRVDDELLEQLRAQAHKEKVSLTRLVNRTLKAGLQVARARRPKQPLYRERAQALGAPRVSLDQALALAVALEDEEIVRELALRR